MNYGEEEEKVYNKILRFVTLRPRSVKEVKDWFRRKKVSSAISGEVFGRLKELGLVDDVGFAKWWIEQRVTFRPRARRVISFELRQKGVSREDIDSAFEVSDVPSDEELARRIVVKRKSKQGLRRYLARLGFSWDVVRRVIDSNLR